MRIAKATPGQRPGRLVAAATAAVAVALLTGCASSSSSSSSSSAAAPATSGSSSSQDSSSSSSSSGDSSASATSSPGNPGAHEVDVNVAGKKVTPPLHDEKATVGERIHLVVTSDAANEVHVHGVNIEKKVAAGASVTFDFSFPAAGIYEVETHDPQLTLMRFLVQ